MAPAHTASHSATLGKGIGYSEVVKETEKGGIVEKREWRIGGRVPVQRVRGRTTMCGQNPDGKVRKDGTD